MSKVIATKYICVPILSIERIIKIAGTCLHIIFPRNIMICMFTFFSKVEWLWFIIYFQLWRVQRTLPRHFSNLWHMILHYNVCQHLTPSYNIWQHLMTHFEIWWHSMLCFNIWQHLIKDQTFGTKLHIFMRDYYPNCFVYWMYFVWVYNYLCFNHVIIS